MARKRRITTEAAVAAVHPNAPATEAEKEERMNTKDAKAKVTRKPVKRTTAKGYKPTVADLKGIVDAQLVRERIKALEQGSDLAVKRYEKLKAEFTVVRKHVKDPAALDALKLKLTRAERKCKAASEIAFLKSLI